MLSKVSLQIWWSILNPVLTKTIAGFSSKCLHSLCPIQFFPNLFKNGPEFLQMLLFCLCNDLPGNQQSGIKFVLNTIFS